MKRRQFLSSTLQAGIASGLLPSVLGAQSTEDARRQGESFEKLPDALVGPPAVEGYFDDAALHRALGTDSLLKPKDLQVVAYNFPSWHPSPVMEQRFGRGWTEFDTLRNSRPLFPGHSMPHYPLWGYYDEADPSWAAKEIDLAADHGVDAWLVDWYWHNGLQFYQEQLERGFLQAPNRQRLKFAVMWANHDWKNVYPAQSPDKAAIMIPQAHSLPDFERVLDYCAEHYFSQPNYLRIDDAPLFALFDAGKVTEQLGRDGLKAALAVMRERAVKLGFPKLHLQVCNGYDNIQSQLREFGFDSATQYGTFGWTYGSKPPGSRIPFGVGASEAVESWKKKRSDTDIPFFPCCSVGWDDSPRFKEFASVAINRSPDQFERLVRAARHMSASAPHSKMIYIAAWNEWTEDHVLLPDTYWGYSYLEALRRAVRD
jgi:Glycosyltransferase WbsX